MEHTVNGKGGERGKNAAQNRSMGAFFIAIDLTFISTDT
jgi:hypothetical protein